MKKDSTVFQIFSTVGTKIIVLFGSFFISIIIARFLGPEGKGVVTAIFVIPNLLVSFADLGIRQATAYYVGRKIFPATKVYTSILLLWIITSLTSVLIATLYYLTGPTQLYGWPILIIPLITIPLLLLNKYMDGLFLGLQQIYTINIIQLIGFMVNLFSVLFLIVFLNLGVYGAAASTLITALITLIFSLIIIKRFIKTNLSYEKGIGKTLINKGIAYAVALFILNLNYKIDIIFLERLTTASDVGVYSTGVAVAELIWQIPAAMGIVLFSKSANSSSDSDAVTRSIKLLRISWIPILLFSILFWIFAPSIIKVLFGIEFINSVSVIRFLLPGIIAMVLFKILNADLAGRGYPLFALKAYILALIINVFLNFFLIPPMGINGAALASTVSYIIGAFVFSILYSKNSNIKYCDLYIINMSDIKLIKSFLFLLKNKINRGK